MQLVPEQIARGAAPGATEGFTSSQGCSLVDAHPSAICEGADCSWPASHRANPNDRNWICTRPIWSRSANRLLVDGLLSAAHVEADGTSRQTLDRGRSSRQPAAPAIAVDSCCGLDYPAPETPHNAREAVIHAKEARTPKRRRLSVNEDAGTCKEVASPSGARRSPLPPLRRRIFPLRLG